MIATPFRLAAALAIALGVAAPVSFAAGQPRFYPAADAPLSAEPFLVPIESALPATSPQPTLKFPLPLTGARLATIDEFLTALEAAITASPADAADIVLAARKAVRISDGTLRNSPVAVDVADLIFSAGNVPAAVPHMSEILAALLAEDPADATVITSNVLAVAAAGGATSAELRALARTGAASLLDGFRPADAPYEEFARAVLVGSITENLVGRNNSDLAAGIIGGLIEGIRDRGLETPLIDDVVRGCTRAFGSMPDVTLAQIATAAFTNATPTRHHAILISAACVMGTPFFYLDGPIDTEIADAGAAALPAFAAVISTASTHCLTIRLTELRVVGAETLARIRADGTALSDAIVCAALMAKPTKAYDILRAGFDGTYGPGITPPPITFPEWIRVVISGYPKFAAEGLSLIVARGNSEGLFTGGVTIGDAIGAVVTGGLPSATPEILAKVKTLLSSGGAPDLPENARALTTAIAASPQPLDVTSIIGPLLVGDDVAKRAALKNAILGATDPVLRSVIAAAAIAAEPLNTASYTAVAQGADSSLADNAAINAVLAGTQIGPIAAQPKWRIAAVLKSLIEPRPGQTRAVVNGALFAAPRQKLAILTAAMSADATFDLQAARALDPDDATPLALAAKICAAEVADATDPGATLAMLFDAVDSAVLAHPTQILELTAAASIAAPRYAHHTLHAAAFRYPAVAMRTVLTTFDAAPIAAPGNQTGRAAALGAALVNGIREARTGTLATTQLRLAVGAAVTSARRLIGPSVATSNGIVNRASLTTANGPAAVITGVTSQLTLPTDITFRGAFLLTPAVQKSPGSALAIAQAAAQTSVSVAGAKVNATSIAAAVAAAAPPFNAAQIRNATAFGRLRGRAGVLGAGADGVRGYQHHSGTTDPVASLDSL